MDAQGHGTVPGIDTGNHAGNQLLLLGAELVIDHPLLRLTDALDNDLAGGLRGYPAEVPGLDLHADHIAQLGLGQGVSCLVQADLRGGVVHHLHHFLLQKQADSGGLLIGLDDQIFPHPLVVLLIGGQKGLGNLLHHIAGLDALLLLNLGDGGKELLAVQLIAVDFFGCSLSHDSFLLKQRKRRRSLYSFCAAGRPNGGRVRQNRGYSRTRAISFFSKFTGLPPTSRVTFPSSKARSRPTWSLRPSLGR